MICPKCKKGLTTCIDSRPSKETAIRRRRKCIDCGYRFTTIEVRAEEYEEQKLKASYVMTMLLDAQKVAEAISKGVKRE